MVAESEAVVDYEAQAREFLDLARQYLDQGNLHQASEKGWGAAAHMAKAVALSQGWSYDTHADFYVVLRQASRAVDKERLLDLRATANDLHGNYYRRKRFLNGDEIRRDLARISELVELLSPLVEALESADQ